MNHIIIDFVIMAYALSIWGNTQTVKGICLYKYKSFNKVWRFLYERYQKILRRK